MPMSSMPTASPPASAYPRAKGMAPEELDALIAQGYFDGGDGELIPPMPQNPYGGQSHTMPDGSTMAGPPMGGGAGQTPGSYAAPTSNQRTPGGYGMNPTIPGANAGGGPSSPPPDIQSGIFQSMYNAGQPPTMPPLMGRPQNNETSGPPPGMPDLMPPLPQEDPFYLQAQPQQMPGPMPGPGPNAPGRRFPRATSLIPSSAGPMRRGY